MSNANEATARESILKSISRFWWILLIRGILLFLLGGYALFNPGMTAAVLVQVIGVFIIAEGILSVIAALMGETSSKLWTGIRGVLAILVGLFVFGHAAVVAGITATVILYVIGIFAVIAGLMEVVVAVQDRDKIEGAGWLVFAGALMVLFGLVLFAAPLNFGMFIVRLFGVFAMFNGLSLVALSFRIKSIGAAIDEN